METHYTNEKNTLIVLGLLKAHGIRKMVVSPGTTNIRLVASAQQDPFFEIYSAADERSAAYMACGMAAQSGEPVVLSCTGATASRNYIPGLTEAYYRKLPVLAITSTQHQGRIGQNVAQVLDRSVQLNDMVKLSVQIPTCYSKEDEWACNVQVNRALLELNRRGGGPVHINLETLYSMDFSVVELPEVHPIYRVGTHDEFPKLPNGKIVIFVGAHAVWTQDLTKAVNDFCATHDAVVLCDHSSNYRGPYRVLFNLVTSQDRYRADCAKFDLMIHIGDISGAYPQFDSKEEWRVNPDGEIRDTFKHLTRVFEMEEQDFFLRYNQRSYAEDAAGAEFVTAGGTNQSEKLGDVISANECGQCAGAGIYLKQWQAEDAAMRKMIPELPFSNLWVAQHTASRLPERAILHLGILNTLRSWNFFETPESVEEFCNTGGFGIDGILSAAIGASLAEPRRLVFVALGDLAFFYDMNSIGNRHVGNNLRVLLVNNGKGTEFRNYNHHGAQFGEDADAYVAAAGHYGNKSKSLVKHYAEDLGFEYLSASSKEEYLTVSARFLTPELSDRPMLLEVFTDSEDESDALKAMRSLVVDPNFGKGKALKAAVKSVIGEKGVAAIKKILK